MIPDVIRSEKVANKLSIIQPIIESGDEGKASYGRVYAGCLDAGIHGTRTRKL